MSKISATGRYVAFESTSTNLVPGDDNGYWDIFVHDRWTGETSRVSVDSAGMQGNRDSTRPAISADGRYVAFSSYAFNLVSDDTNNLWDVFVHDRHRRATSRVSLDSTGIQQNAHSGDLSISGDGHSVAFDSFANNLVSGDTNDSHDVFVRDLRTCRAGNVNAGAGDATDVLFVNDTAGGPERTVRLNVHEPLTIFVAAPPSAAGAAPFALYAWRALPVPGAPAYPLPFEIGQTCLPTPLIGGSPSPRVIWNNTGLAIAGVPTFPSSPAPSIVLRRSRALARPASAFLQGIIRDRGAINGRAAVTNGVSIEIR